MRRPALLAAGALAAAAVLAVPIAMATTAASAGDPVVVAAGDIACDPDSPNFHHGTGTPNTCHEAATADLVERIGPRAVLALGDLQYEHSDGGKYARSYGPTWGRFAAITRPAIGNHEGSTGEGSPVPYFDYFGADAGDPTTGYYSFDIGSWHLVALNTDCGQYTFRGSSSGCARGGAQERWLAADLAAHPTACTLAFFHVPRFSSGSAHHSDATTDHALTALWDDLYAAGVDVVLGGHAHDYERFAPMRPDGQVDPVDGVREFVVGTGGEDHQKLGRPVPGSEVRDDTTFGVLALTLHATSYDWAYRTDTAAASATPFDTGSGSCHAAPTGR